ncbi:hypothetical protein DFQ27_000841 [Actinomortierella ambigua]|uniref:Uncharacterized protein n=1 Tax=Actinomortierella ambigua TaxID=1343610 RepID=A0A9P6QDX4_9FUNG|nr:hypothetical protein DFQ27_000841 [Actinomortierella ambigua]
MSTVTAIAPEPIPQTRRGGLASIKTMFGSKKRHTIAQMPTAEDSSAVSTPEGDSPTAASQQQQASVSTLFTNQKRSVEKAAEKERKEQAKQTFQLSTIDDHGVFRPPTPMEKPYREHFIDSDADYFDMIINTPPERVKMFLSAEKSISPYMFSEPRSAKNKRHTVGSFGSWSRSEYVTTAAHTRSPPAIPPKDLDVVQVTVATQDSTALEEALSSSINSLLDSSSQEVPELVEDSGSESSTPAPSPTSSANVSPRSSTSSLTKDSVSQQENTKRIRQQLFGEELTIPF